jgi:acetoin utilization deacetylase AcuC-like enzyme
MPAPTFMAGYCFIDNASVPAQALRGPGCSQLPILDVDYHHGNGTQGTFYERPDVPFVGRHGGPQTEFPFYLVHADVCGAGPAGIPVEPAASAGSSAGARFDTLEIACASLARHLPGALVVSLGGNTIAGEPTSMLRLPAVDFARHGVRLRRLVRPTLFVVEGGDAAGVLGASAANVV